MKDFNSIRLFKQLVVIFTLFSLSFFNHGCIKGCREDPTFCDYPEVTERYFKNYRAGSYWIYINQDSTKTDSIYVYNYVSEITGDYNVACIEFEERRMKLASEYLPINWSTSKIDILYTLNDCTTSSFGTFMLKDNIIINAKQNTDELLASNPDFYSLKLIDSIHISNNIFSEVYIYHGRYWLAPEVGLIKFISYNQVDTFYIQNYYFQ